MAWQVAGKSNQAAEANAQGELFTFNRLEEVKWNAAGRLWLAYVSNTPALGAKVFLHVANTSSDRPIYVVEIFFTSATAEQIDVFLGSLQAAGLTGGTKTNLVPMNGSGGLTPPVTFNLGTGITGTDANAKQRDYLSVTTANASDRRYLAGRIAIPPNGELYLQTVTGNVAVKCGVVVGFPPLFNEAVQVSA